MKTLILFAHPALNKSNVNKTIAQGLKGLDHVTFHDLYDHYPEFDIDIDKEQELLSSHDVIVFQFPLFWYSTPAILKEWQDLVLEHGWAFGSKGNALKGKLFFCSLTSGGPQESYQEDSFHLHTINQFLAPLEQTARLCKMRPLPPFVVHGAHGITKPEVEDYLNQLIKLLDEFKTNSFDLEKAIQNKYLNHYINNKEN